MKKHILIFVLSSLLCSGADIFAQDFMPDEIYTSQNDSTLVWFTDGTAFCYQNGVNYAFVWTVEIEWGSYRKRWYPYVYEFKNNDFQPFMVDGSPKLEFGYLHEDHYGYYSPYRKEVTIVGNAFAFSYFGFLWYSCVIEHPPYVAYYPGTYFRLWARYDQDSLKWDTWYDELDERPPKYNVGAYQVDSLLHMVYYDETLDSDGKPIGFGKDIYRLNPSTRKLTLKENTGLRLPGTKLGGMFAYKDSCNNVNHIYNTYIEGTIGWITKSRNSTAIYSSVYTPVGASVLMQGSAQGSREIEAQHAEEGNRFNIFTLGTVRLPDKSYPLYNSEWFIPDNCDLPAIPVHTFLVTLPVTCEPFQIGGRFQLGYSIDMEAQSFDSPDSIPDGLSRKLKVYYTDGDGHFYGASFNSDMWRPVEGSVVSNTDLDAEDVYGPEVRKLWTLVGITDGAPPCGIDWHTWENSHTPLQAPTKFSFELENISDSKISSTYTDSYALGYSTEVSYKKKLGLDLSFEYAHTYQNTVRSGTKIITQNEKTFDLNEVSQEKGYFLWHIPQITRTSYMVYPWYDENLDHPVSNSLQYQFSTTSALLMKESVDISSFPFHVDDPNDSLLNDFTQESRQIMYHNAEQYHMEPYLHPLQWEGTTEGDRFLFTQVDCTVSEVSKENSYTYDESLNFGIPRVFNISGNASQSINYSSEYSYETEMGTTVHIDLGNLILPENGITTPPPYTVDVYWFKPNKGEWWFLDSLEGQNPWYIGYIVRLGSTKLVQLSPENDCNIKGSDLLFSWKAIDGELNNYELLISEGPRSGPGLNTYTFPCGRNTVANPEEFIPEPGKTYSWSVRGYTKKGEPVWSGSRSFTFGVTQSGQGPSLLKATLYPNPGRAGYTNISYDLPEDSKVTITVYNTDGQLLNGVIENSRQAGINTESLATTGFNQGIYFVIIQTDQRRAVKKLVIQ